MSFFFKKIKIPLTVLVLSIGIFSSLYKSQAQERGIVNPKNNWAIEAGVKYGNIFKHTPRFQPEVTEISGLYELSFSYNTNGQKLWEQFHNYPIINLSFIHGRYGNADVFGQSYSFLPSITFLTRKKHINLHYRIGAGLGYLNRPYHRITNASNNVIGSKVNNITMFMLGVEWKIRPQWRLIGTGAFTHYSNAKVQAPNLGINMLTYGLTLKHYPKLPNTFEEYQRLEVAEFDKPFKLATRLGYGIHEFGEVGGPHFAIYVNAVYFLKRINETGQLQLGVETNFYTGIYHFILNQVAFQENQVAKAMKIAPFVGYEFLFGRFSAVTQLGVYAYDPFLQREPIFTRLGLQFYRFPNYEGRIGKQFFVGVYLKAHYARADFVEMGVGYIF